MIRLNYGGVVYDRTLALMSGRAGEGRIGLDYNVVPDIAELFKRVCADAEFEAAEISLSSLTSMISRGDDRYIGIPVFPSRCFRHSFIFVRGDRIQEPADLAGKRIGVEEYGMTAAVWVRGVLEHDFGVPPSAIHWRFGGLATPARHERLPLELPDDVELEPIPADRALEEMLFSGDLDALVATGIPAQFDHRRGPVKRLFENYLEVERDYFKRTGIFPIMHTVGVRRDVYERHPEAPGLLLDAFREAKELSRERLDDLHSLAVALPWLGAELEQIEELFDGDPFPFGFEANARVLETLVGYSYEQGLSSRRVDPRELFAPEVLD